MSRDFLTCFTSFRYLRPIRPPPVIEQLIVPMTSAETIGQVASYIPFLADPLLFPGTIDLWTTMEQVGLIRILFLSSGFWVFHVWSPSALGDLIFHLPQRYYRIFQFVSIGCGDEEEHAVLVCCWLLGLHIQCYLVLGRSITYIRDKLISQ